MSNGGLATLALDQEAYNRVMLAIVDAVAVSYAREGGQRSDAEDKRRAGIAIEAVRVMRGDLDYAVARVCAALPEAVCTIVRGEHWEPQAGIGTRVRF